MSLSDDDDIDFNNIPSQQQFPPHYLPQNPLRQNLQQYDGEQHSDEHSLQNPPSSLGYHQQVYGRFQ